MRLFCVLCGLGLILCMGLWQCTGPRPVQVDAILPLSGAARYVGQEVRDGMGLAVREINRDGGINGRTLQVSMHDSATDLDQARGIYKRLQSTQHLLTVSCLSSVSMALAPLAEQKKDLLFSLVATAPELTSGREWVYRYWPTADQEVPPIMSVLTDRRISRLGIIYLNDAYGRSVAAYLQDKLEAKPNMSLKTRAFDFIEQEFVHLIRDIQDTQAVCVVGFDFHIAEIVRGLRRVDYPGTIISTTTATLPKVTSLPAADGMFVVAPAIYNPNFRFADGIKSKYEQTYDKSFTQYSANGYDFIKLLAGLMEGQAVTQASLKEGLEKGFVYSGVFGNIELRPGAQDIDFPLFPARIHDTHIVYR